MRALIPVSHRSRATMSGANQLSGYLCDLPVSESDPAMRLATVRDTMQRNKATGPLRGPGALPLLAGLLPPVLHRVLMPLVARHADLLFDLVVTTLRCPTMPLSLCGSEVSELYPLVPLAPGHALGVAFLHYGGRIHIGLHADADAVPDLDKLIEALHAAVIELAEAGANAK